MKMRTGAETLIFWGAGATASAGFKMTLEQTKAIKSLAGSASGDILAERIEKVGIPPDWGIQLRDLLLVLGDDAENDVHHVTSDASEAMCRHWHDHTSEALLSRIHELRAIFDWAALTEVIRVCPGFNTTDRLQIQDIFNVIDLHVHSFHGFRGLEHFLPPSRLIAARRALQLILNTLFFIDWQCALKNEKNRVELNKHLGLADLLTKHHQDKGLDLASQRSHFDSRDFYLGDIAFCSLNYDPLALWAQFIANKEANEKSPYIGFPRVPLKIFHDFGIFMAVSTIDSSKTDGVEAKERVWYPLNEASAQRLNDRDHQTGRRVRINKFLFPHGCLCWRECPSCGKLSAYMGKEWDFLSPALIPPPPLRGFAELAGMLQCMEPEDQNEKNAWRLGMVDARSCVHCGELTFSQHTQAIMQSNFKAAPPSFIEEVQRDLRVATQAANHIILMGYSLPPDDVTYRAIFAARQQRIKKNGENSPVHCSIVVGIGFGDRWYGSAEIDELLMSSDKMKPGEAPRTTLEAARDIFGIDNVRFYGGGIPQVFCDGEIASSDRLQKLINWGSIV